ncbi:CD40 ligand [Tachyglossus aculeatus]|uniref:CD40 ligand n=1 Tax=Tachyglossus aculeatus TaxID=9261 RepID=UPI0018F52234|nr:CD40 ligand [Tachyglossus aculeatus]
MNEVYSQPSPRSVNTGSPATMKFLLGFLTVFVTAQIIATALFGIYLHRRLDKVKDEMSLHEDYVFMKTVQKCHNGGASSTLLNCEEIRNRFQKLLEGKEKEERGEAFLKQTDEQKHPIAAHLIGVKNNESASVLQWMKKGRFTMSHLLSYKAGKLTVERPGLYYIYAQVGFCSKDEATDKEPFVTYLYLSQKSGAVSPLLKGANSQTSTQHCGLQSIHIGGVFDLQRGVSVFVKVTKSSQVFYDSELTYFGLIKL